MTTPRALRWLALALLAWSAGGAVVATGPASPAAASYDRVFDALLTKYQVPAAAVAVARNGKLVVARGYGVADPQTGQPPQPTSLFRIASVSKPITAVAIFRLVEQGRLKLDQPVLDLLGKLVPAAGLGDERWQQITIRHLLQHTGGWDKDEAGYDPMFYSGQVSQALGTPPPASAESVVRYMLAQPLQFDPGSRMVYSNFGYCLLGRVIEAVTGQSYTEAVQSAVLRPMGITAMRQARSRREERQPGEVCYAMPAGTPAVPSVFADVAGDVPWPYGGFHVEAMDSHGGWLASPVDLVRFGLHVSLLSAATLREMTARPAPPLPQNGDYWYACGWLIRPAWRDANWWHSGAMPGTATILVRTGHGFVWAATLNAWPDPKISGALDEAMWQALGGATEWPSEDLFDSLS